MIPCDYLTYPVVMLLFVCAINLMFCVIRPLVFYREYSPMKIQLQKNGYTLHSLPDHLFTLVVLTLKLFLFWLSALFLISVCLFMLVPQVLCFVHREYSVCLPYSVFATACPAQSACLPAHRASLFGIHHCTFLKLSINPLCLLPQPLRLQLNRQFLQPLTKESPGSMTAPPRCMAASTLCETPECQLEHFISAST